jgi:hypothetical protein
MVNEVSGWVWPANVRKALEYISSCVDYRFDDLDWTAVETALPHTSWDPPERWYDYPIVGTQTLTVLLACDSAFDPVGITVRGDLDPVQVATIETTIAILADIVPADG